MSRSCFELKVDENDWENNVLVKKECDMKRKEYFLHRPILMCMGKVFCCRFRYKDIYIFNVNKCEWDLIHKAEWNPDEADAGEDDDDEERSPATVSKIIKKSGREEKKAIR
jgi:hypothetical protein